MFSENGILTEWSPVKLGISPPSQARSAARAFAAGALRDCAGMLGGLGLTLGLELAQRRPLWEVFS